MNMGMVSSLIGLEIWAAPVAGDLTNNAEDQLLGHLKLRTSEHPLEELGTLPFSDFLIAPVVVMVSDETCDQSSAGSVACTEYTDNSHVASLASMGSMEAFMPRSKVDQP